MPNAKNRLQIFKSSYLQVAGILLLIIFAALMMWFNHVNSTQAISATVAKVRFYGEYRIGDRQWQEITEGQHIPATKGDVTLRGNFHMLTPDGEYVGVYRGELPVAFYSNHISLTIYEGSNEPFVMYIENADKEYPYADVQAFFLQRLHWIMRKSSDAMYSFVRSILQDWRVFFSQKKLKRSIQRSISFLLPSVQRANTQRRSCG